jgi:transposase
MRYELSDYEWTAISPFLPNKPRGVPRVDDNNTLTPVVGCVRIAIQILRIL